MLALLAVLALAFPQDTSAPSGQEEVQAEPTQLQRLLTAIQLWTEDAQTPNERDYMQADLRAAEAVDLFLADPGETSLEGFNELVVGLYRSQRYDDCLRVAGAGIDSFEQPFGMHEYAGLSRLVLAQNAENSGEMLSHSQAALASLLAARALDPESPPPQLYLYYVYSALGRFDEALAEFDAMCESSPYADQLTTSRHYTRGRILLGAGRYAEAVSELTGEESRAEELGDSATYLVVRALALSGKPGEAVKAARGLWEHAPSEESLSLLADALAFAGESTVALALLKDTSLMAPLSDESEAAAAHKSRAVIAHLIALDGKRSPELRAQLTTLLDHKFIVAGSAGSGTGDTDLAASPLCLAYLTRQVPWSYSSWVNDLLFVLCVEDAVGYEPVPLEKAITSQLIDAELLAAVQGPDAHLRALEGLRVHRVMPDSTCVLTLERLMQ